MGVNFNWFKDYKVITNTIFMGSGEYIECEIKYLDGDSTSHSYGNRTKLQDIFKKYLDIEIPTIEDYLYSETVIGLIEPSLMSSYCDKLLSNTENNLEDMESRIQSIKELSDNGYYVSYDVS